MIAHGAFRPLKHREAKGIHPLANVKPDTANGKRVPVTQFCIRELIVVVEAWIGKIADAAVHTVFANRIEDDRFVDEGLPNRVATLLSAVRISQRVD